jgi:hypothetical protein
MQVFIIGTPLETAMALDSKRLRKQIIECRQILDALNSKTAWSNHPCVLQYRGHRKWLYEYMQCLEQFVMGRVYTPQEYSKFADLCRPPFHTQDYYDQMKRRLYTKDKEHYKQWAHLGESDENWYFVDGEWRKYVNGKRIE